MDFVLEGKRKSCRLSLPATWAIEGEPKMLILLYDESEKKLLAPDTVLSTPMGKQKKKTRPPRATYPLQCREILLVLLQSLLR